MCQYTTINSIQLQLWSTHQKKKETTNTKSRFIRLPHKRWLVCWHYTHAHTHIQSSCWPEHQSIQTGNNQKQSICRQRSKCFATTGFLCWPNMLLLLHLKWHLPLHVAGNTARNLATQICFFHVMLKQKWVDICLPESSISKFKFCFIFWIDKNLIGLERKWVVWNIFNTKLNYTCWLFTPLKHSMLCLLIVGGRVQLDLSLVIILASHIHTICQNRWWNVTMFYLFAFTCQEYGADGPLVFWKHLIFVVIVWRMRLALFIFFLSFSIFLLVIKSDG